jgi:hypothetical protein
MTFGCFKPELHVTLNFPITDTKYERCSADRLKSHDIPPSNNLLSAISHQVGQGVGESCRMSAVAPPKRAGPRSCYTASTLSLV